MKVAEAADIQNCISFTWGRATLKNKLASTIKKEKLSHLLQDVFQKIDTMLSYDKSNRGWAVFWKESAMATHFKHGVMSDEELFMVKKLYIESRQDPTMVESNCESRMPQYSVYDPSLFDPAVIMYIQEVWQFKEPILIVLDPQGKEVNNNTHHMLWIWGSLAFPFTVKIFLELKKQTEEQ
ncbi:hypothetical protein Pint_28827 [Pistacia integerrima]|uniref:Uncharacterized protein n=1 Tax=Pistacia integerrima TaxID=434235 RepID=A0ACC0WYM4_9ROSI|nr:hypothetical protein Pint_28827 [Pistacia integerrima]